MQILSARQESTQKKHDVLNKENVWQDENLRECSGQPISGALRWTPILISDFCQLGDVELLTGDFGHFADCPPVWPCTSLPRACSGQKQVGRD